MRVHEGARRSVVFVGVETDRGFIPYGTGFVGLTKYEDMVAPVIVTARHVLDSVTQPHFSVRINRKDGTASTLRLDKANIILFDKKPIDIAVVPAPIDASIFDVFAIHMDAELWKKQIEDAALGTPQPGDEISIVGLYTSHYGHVKNMPIVRIGHVAAVPDEELLTPWGFVTGFLVEVHSIAGLSGSPVFWNLPPVKIVNKELKYLTDLVHIPIGIFIGYHVIQSREDEMIVPEYQQSREQFEEKELPKTLSDERRTGFGVVLPIGYVFGIFESEQMQQILKTAVEDARKGSGFRPASAPILMSVISPSGDENPNHREDFTSLLNAAAKKRPRDGQTSPDEKGGNSDDK